MHRERTKDRRAHSYADWRARQVSMMTGLRSDRQARYLRGIKFVWGDVVALDVQRALKRNGGSNGQEESGKAEEAWKEANARVLREKGARLHALNYGSRRLARDPAVIIEAEEGRSCKGCLYEYRVTLVGDVELACSLGKYHGPRCTEYLPRSARA